MAPTFRVLNHTCAWADHGLLTHARLTLSPACHTAVAGEQVWACLSLPAQATQITYKAVPELDNRYTKHACLIWDVYTLCCHLFIFTLWNPVDNRCEAITLCCKSFHAQRFLYESRCLRLFADELVMALNFNYGNWLVHYWIAFFHYASHQLCLLLLFSLPFQLIFRHLTDAIF